MFQKQRLKVGQCVVFAKQAPDTVFVVGIAAVELYGFQLGKLLNKSFIDDELLDAILTGDLYSCLPMRFFKNSVI
jgi:hypothetical protein